LEISPFVTLLALTALCVPLASTRKYAVFFTAILVWIYPVPSFVVLALAGIAYFIYRKRQRRNYVLPRSDT
jgi:hypothetical protein